MNLNVNAEGGIPPPPDEGELPFLSKGKLLRFLVVAGLAVCTFLLPLPGLDEAGRRMLFIFALCAGLWVTDTIEPYATAILGVGLQILLLALPGLAPEGTEIPSQIFLQPIASPVIVLFFGGFVLALAAQKYGLDRFLAGFFLRPFLGSGQALLFGVIGVTALLSMWMSNTATAALMLAVLMPVVSALPEGSKMRSALILGTAFGANLGGMGTIIGTPPNAIAALTLSNAGVPVRFFDWMLFGVPMTCLALGVLWLVLRPLCDVHVENLRELIEGERKPFTRCSALIAGTFGMCVALWITEAVHGVPAGVVALIPVVVFTFLGIVKPHDLARVEWTVLILVAGGISLGEGMKVTGLSAWLIDLLPLEHMTPLQALLGFCVFVVVFSNFMSNSAAAALVVPLAISVAPEMPFAAAVCVALSASMGISLPVSTPPNAIAYASGCVSTRLIAIYGSIVSALCLGLVIILGIILWRVM